MHTALATTENLLGDAAFSLGEAESRHLAAVLRAAPGDVLALLDGFGHRRTARVVEAGRRAVVCRPHGEVETLPPPAVAITLFQCVAKPSRMDWLVEKAAELGVACLVPVVSARAVARPASGEKSDRWRRIAESALRQSASGWLMEVGAPLTWPEALRAMRAFGGRLFVGALTGETQDAGALLMDLRRADFSGPVGWLIGPEGDLAPEELEAAVRDAGAAPVSLGAQVLRVETAALFAVSATQAVLGARGG